MKKVLIFTVVVFLLLTLLFTWGFIHEFGHNKTIGMATLRNIVVDRALFMSIPIAVAYFCIHVLVIKLENKWLLALLVLLILALLYAILGYYFLLRVIIISILENPFVD